MATLQEEAEKLRKAFIELFEVIGFIRFMDWTERKLRYVINRLR